jgi:protocatechuate 3,4-dioxygenase beta subunit
MSSTSFPTTFGAFDTTLGTIDAFATKLNTAGSGLVYSTYLGGGGDDRGVAIALDGLGNGYVTGRTASADLPTTVGAFDTSFNGVNDAFVTKLDFVGAPATLTLAPKTGTNTAGTPHTVTVTVKDFGGNAVPGVTVRFSANGANSASGSAVTNANGEATFTYTGTRAGLDLINAFADSDNDGTQDAGEPADTATKTWTPGAPATLTLAPSAGVNTVDTEHCVTATVRDLFGNAVPNVTVIFSVPNAGATHASPSSGSAVTDANGQATFCFTASLPGADAIHAFADADNDGVEDVGEPSGAATKAWTLPPSTAFCNVTITEGGSIIAVNGDLANFSGNAKVSADGLSVQGQEQYRDTGPAQPRDVQSIMLTAVTCSADLTTATIFGTATIDGSGTFVFRIDVSDQGEPGTNDSYGIILSDGYASGQQRLQAGNVQIHKS